MIQKVVEYINTNIELLKIFKVVNGLCQMGMQDESAEESGVIKTFPVYYKGKDQLANITDFDFRNGVTFWLKNGQVNIETLESMRANIPFLRYVTPLRLYAIHSRSVIDDSAYTPDKLGANLVHSINQQTINSLRSELNVKKIQVQAKGYNTDSSQIGELFQNVEVNFLESLCIVSVEADIMLEGYQACFINFTC